MEERVPFFTITGFQLLFGTDLCNRSIFNILKASLWLVKLYELYQVSHVFTVKSV